MENTLECKECKFEIPSGASRCGHCGSTQVRWKSLLLQWGGIASAILLLIPIWQIAISMPKTILGPKDVLFDAQAYDCTMTGMKLKVRSLDADRFIEVSSVEISLVTGGDIDDGVRIEGETINKYSLF